MDYKSRHRGPLIWRPEVFDTSRFPEPFDDIGVELLREVTSPDGSAVFLVMHGDLEPAENVGIAYAIEAPPSCPARIAFENGEISWPDFWAHHGWLLRLRVHFNRGPVEAAFITPTQLPSRTVWKLNYLGSNGPFNLKRRMLERRCEIGARFGGDPVKAEREYRDFMLRHGYRFALQDQDNAA